MGIRKTISNFGYLAFGEFASKAFGFFTMVYLARVLGAVGFGFYGFVSSISAYVILFSSFGIETYSTQQLAAHNEQTSQHTIEIIITTRLLLSTIFIGLFIVFGMFYSHTDSEKLLFVYQSIFILAFSFSLQFYFVTSKNVATLAFIKVGVAACTLLFTYFFIQGQTDLHYTALISGCVTFVFHTYGVYTVLRKFNVRVIIPTLSEICALIKLSFPLGVSAFMIQIYHNADIIFLGFTNPGTELGYYTGAYRIINLISAVPGLWYLVFLPDLAKIANGYFSAKATREYIAVVIGTGIIIVGMCFLFSTEIIKIILGEEYLPSENVFHILLINTFLIFVNVAFANLLIAWKEHRKYLFVVSSGAVINIIFNIILIPAYGINGAAVATVCAEISVFVSTLYYIRKYFTYSFTTK